MRASFTMNLLLNETPVLIVQKVLGHLDLKSTQHYLGELKKSDIIGTSQVLFGGTKKKSAQSAAIIVGEEGVGRPWDCLNCSIEKLDLGVGTCNVGLRCVFVGFCDPISAEGYWMLHDDGSELARTGVDG